MFPLLRPSVGTGTEVNPARQRSQKPGIRFPLKGRKRPPCRARQTTAATHPMWAQIRPCTPCAHTYTRVRPHRRLAPHVHMQALVCPTHGFAECTHTRSPHSHRLTSHAHMRSRIHTPTADSIHAHTRAPTPPVCTYTQTPHIAMRTLWSHKLSSSRCWWARLWRVGGRGGRRAAPGESGLMGTQA